MHGLLAAECKNGLFSIAVDGCGQRLAGRCFGSLRPLGRGGFAPVWLAAESFGGTWLRDVAVKLFFVPEGLRPGSAELEQWHNSVVEEASALCRVEHPFVVRFYSLQRDDTLGVLGLVMEYVPGRSLEDLFLDSECLDEQAVVEAAIPIAWALSAVHDAGLVHRDVKPANIVRGRDGYKLIDFGIFAKFPPHQRQPLECGDSHATDTPHQADPDAISTLVGTVGYIAPECAKVPATPASDLYALGVTMFRLLTGRFPPANTRGAELCALMSSAGVSAALMKLVSQLLEPNPLQRPRHADNLARQLEELRPLSRHARRQPGTKEADKRLGETTWPGHATAQRTIAELHIPPPFVDREEALATIAQAAQGMQRQLVHVLLVSGPMGIGRTRLLDAAIEQMEVSASRILHVRCSPDRRQPLRPMIDALGLLPSSGLRDFTLLLDAFERAMTLACVHEMHRSRPHRTLPALATDALAAIEQALLDESRALGLAVVIDDLQWADSSTLHLLARLAGRAGERGRLLLLGAIRDEPQPSQALAKLLRRIGQSVHPCRKRLRLQPLSPDQSLRLVQSAGPCAPDLAQAVVRGAGGIPALLVHTLLAWRALGAIAWRDGAWQPSDDRALRDDIPGVVDLLQVRLAGFGRATSAARIARQALACVALGGGTLGDDIVAGVLGNHKSVHAVIDGLIGAGILERRPGRRELQFGQEMVRQAALNLTRTARWFDAVHCATLDAIAALIKRSGAAVDAGFLAEGYERIGDRRKARQWLRYAMNATSAVGLFDEVAAFGNRLAALSAPQHRDQVELEIVRAAIQGRNFDAARQHLEQMDARVHRRKPRTAGRLELQKRICRLEIARGLGEHRVHPPALQDPTLIADADRFGDADLCCEARLALAGLAKPADRLALATEAVALSAGRNAALEYAARVRRLEISKDTGCHNLALVDEDLRAAVAIAGTMGSPWHRIHIEGDLAVVEADIGQTETAIDKLRRLAKEAETRRMPGQHRILLQNLSALLLRTERFDQAVQSSDRLADLAHAAGDPGLCARARSVQADALFHLGLHDEALRRVEEALASQTEIGDPRRALTLLRRARILQALDRLDDALADAQMASAAAEAHDDIDYCLSARLWYALAMVRSGRAPRDLLVEALADALRARVTLRPLTLRLIAEAKAWLQEHP